MADSYWEERQKRYREQMERDEEKLNRRLGRYYDREARELESQIASYYSQYGDGNVLEYRTMMEVLSDADRDLLMRDMERFFAEHPDKAHLMPVRESIYKLNRLEGLQASVTMRQLEAGAWAEEEVKAHLEKQAERGYEMSQKALGLGSEVNAMDREAVKAIASAPWSNGESFSDRIWKNTAKVSEYVNTDIAQGIARGDSYEKLVASTMDRFKRVSKRDAMRLVYTEGTHVAAESQAKAFEQDFELYKLSPAPGACPICQGIAQNGPFRFKTRQPGTNYPPIHPWCRCSIEVVVDDWERWMDDYKDQHGAEATERTLEMFRNKDGANRRTDGAGNEVIAAPLYNKLTKPFLSRGGVIIRGKTAETHLKNVGGSASYIAGADIAFIKDAATVSDVLEEMYHAEQDRRKLYGGTPWPDILLLRELDAQKYLLSVADRYKINKTEVEATLRNFESYIIQAERKGYDVQDYRRIYSENKKSFDSG